MHHKPQTAQFFMSTIGDCPYLPDKSEQKLFTSLEGASAQATQNALSKQGFRRSQNIIYRPFCDSCSACQSARIPCKSFTPTRNQKRILARNRDLSREIRPARASDEQYDLFMRYVSTRHYRGGMSDMSYFDFATMIEECHVASSMIEYRLVENGHPTRLIAASLSDILDDGLSMVYSFFEPEVPRRSLGTYMILDHLELLASPRFEGLNYVYLGYWVKGSPSMGYKSRFRPLELFHHGAWRSLDDAEALGQEVPSSQQVLLRAYEALGAK